MKKIKIILPLILISAFFLLFSNVGSPNIIAKEDKVDKEVKDQLKKQAKVPVIVSLKKDLSGKTKKIKNKEALENEKIKNKEIEDEVLSGLSENDFSLEYQYDNIAAFSGFVSQAGLIKLENNIYVEQVAENRIYYETLNLSNPLIDADTARTTYGIDGSGQTVCILDSGVDYNHVDLGGGGFPNAKILGGYDFVNSDNDPYDDQTHGTHVTGIVASDNATYSGIASGAGIIALKVINSSGAATETNILAAIDWCANHKDTYNIVAMNMSIGDGGQYNVASSCDAGAIGQSITAAKAAGIATFVSSGNNGFANGISYPACASDAISVGAVYNANVGSRTWTTPDPDCTDATTQADKVACASNSDEILDILAPGSIIWAPLKGGGVIDKNGTSMASPMAAGAAALMAEENPNLGPEQIRCALKQSPTTPTDSKNSLSHPRIDIDHAIAFNPTVTGNTSWTGGYQLYDYLGGSVTSGNTVPMGQDLFIKDGSSNIVASVDLDCTANLGTDVSMGQDFGNYKAFVHNLASKASVGDVSLYIPKGAGHDSVWMCPGASNLSEVNAACAGGFTLSGSNPDNGSHHLVTSDPNYWIVEGIENTGGFSQQEETSSVPQLPSGLLWKILLSLISLAAVVSIAAVLKKRGKKGKKKK